jgi:thiol-disulfide isomerase/thioredoxin
MRFVPSRALISLAALGLCATALAQSQPTLAPVQPIDPHKPFPTASFTNLNRAAGGPDTIDLAAVIGKKPVVLYYWIAGHPRADALFLELQSLAESLGPERLAIYGTVFRRSDDERPVIERRLQELEIRLPVLDDDGFRLGQQLRVQSVPNITILDAEGLLRLTNGASLRQIVGYKQTVESAIRKVGESGSVGSYGYLGRYYPVKELVGKQCPDFKAPLLSNSVEQRWSSAIKSESLNVLIFWSVDCPHCRKTLPEINAWLKSHPDGMNVFSAASVTNETAKVKTKEYCEINQFVFPTLVDEDQRISNLYQVTSTPTIVIIGPDGVVDSVMISSTQDFGKKMEEIKSRLLKSGSAS